MIQRLTKIRRGFIIGFNGKGLTLMELMLAMLVLVTALVSISVAYVACFELNETSKNTTLFINAAQKEMERIKNDEFGDIDDQDDATFTPDYLPGDSIGSINVDSTNPDLLEVTVSICWRQKSGRIVGEAVDVGGVLTLQDLDVDGIIDSPVQLTTLISQ